MEVVDEVRAEQEEEAALRAQALEAMERARRKEALSQSLLDDLLHDTVSQQCTQLAGHQMRSDSLRSYTTSYCKHL